jgi:hypothetical protein
MTRKYGKKAQTEKMSILIFIALISNSALGQRTAPNLATFTTPSGSGYFWCDLKPRTRLMSEKFQEKNLLSHDILKLFSAYIETHCVNVTGMSCQKDSASQGTMLTDLALLKTHYFRFEKSGKENDNETSFCGKEGVVQVLVDYAYQVECHTTNMAPQGLMAIDQPAC